MSARRSPNSRWRHGAAWDVMVAGLAVVVLFAIAVIFGVFDRFEDGLTMSPHLNEILGLAVLLLGAAAFVTTRRAGQATREHGLRREAETRFRTIVERVPAVSYVWDGATAPGEAPANYISPQIETMLGYTAEDWLAHPDAWEAHVHPDDLALVLETWNEAVATHGSFIHEYRIRHASGSWRWIRDEATPIGPGSGSGSASVYQGVMLDVTERRDAEERTQEMLRRLPVVAYTTDYDVSSGLVHDRWVAPSIERLTGTDARAWLEDDDAWVHHVDPDDLARVLAKWREIASTGGVFVQEYRMRRTDGATVWIREETSTVLRDGRLRCDGVYIDVSDRYAAEAAKAAAEERYRSLVEQLPVAVYTDAVDALSTAVYISPRYEELTGYTPEERLSQPDLWAEMLHPLDRDRVLAESVRTNETGEPFDIEYRVIRKDGDVAWLHDHATQVAGSDGVAIWQGVLQDVTAQRATLEALARRDAILEATGFAAARFLGAGSWLDGLDEVLERVGRAAMGSSAYVYSNAEIDGDVVTSPLRWWGADLSGASPVALRESGLGRWIDEMSSGRPIHGPVGELPDVERAIFDRLEDPVGSILYVPIHVDGSWWGSIGIDDEDAGRTWHESEIDALRTTANALGGAVERDRATRRYQALIEQIPAVTYVEDAATGIEIYVSPQITTMLGYTVEEWGPEEVWMQAVHPEDRDRVLAEDERASRERDVFRAEYRFLAKDGGVRWVREEAVPVADERSGDITQWQGVRFDVTDEKEAEGRLRAAEERYRLVVEQLPAIAYVDERRPGESRTWPCIYVSPQVETILGFTPEEWMDGPETWDDLIHPDDLERATEADERHYERGDPVDIELRIRARDGAYRWIRDQAVIVYDDEGEPRWSQGIWLDVTERKLAEIALHDAEQRYRGIVEHIPAAIYLDKADASMESMYVSPQIETITGVSRERWLAEPDLWLQLMDIEDRARVEKTYMAAAASHDPWSEEYRLHTPDGRTIWVHDETTFLLDDDGVPTAMQGVIFDITERKLAEQALRESERREREAAERLRSLDEMKNTFLAAVSHELRSPLTSILGLALTLERAPSIPDTDRDDLLVRLAANAKKLDRLLKDLLDIDRLNRGIVEPQLRVTDVGALARRAAESLDTLAGRDVVVRTDAVVIAVDPPKVERIVENLLVNAARHTAADRRIWLGVSSLDGGVLVTVEDDGPGVPRELQATIFEPFRQGPTPSAHAPGTGIGLSLVARFAELHGGRAWVSDREGGGASFQVFLPGGDVVAAPEAAPFPIPERAAG